MGGAMGEVMVIRGQNCYLAMRGFWGALGTCVPRRVSLSLLSMAEALRELPSVEMSLDAALMSACATIRFHCDTAPSRSRLG